MKKRTRIIGIILTCMLLIGAAVGITVSATETEPEVEIAGQNLSYEGLVRVAYYVKKTNIDEAQYSVKLLTSDSPIALPIQIKADSASYKIHEAEATVTIDGESYDVFFSDGVNTAELRKDIYATAVVVTKLGIVDASAVAPVYSPYEYAMNRFDGEYTEDQAELYTAMLDYGAAVQEVVFATEDGGVDEAKVAAAGGWADAYYVVTENLTVDGELKSSVTAEHRAANLNGAYVPDIAKWYGDNKSQILNGVVDLNGVSFFGENYASTANKISLGIGNTGYTASYVTSYGQFVSYDGSSVTDAEHLNDYFDDYYTGANGNTYVHPDYYAGATSKTQYNSFKDGDYTCYYYGKAFAYVSEEGKLVYEKRGNIIKITDASGNEVDASTNYKIGDYYGKLGIPTEASNCTMLYAYQYNTSAEPDTFTDYVKHVYETDITVDAYVTGNVGQFWLNNAYLTTSEYLFGVAIRSNSASTVNEQGEVIPGDFYFTVDGYSVDSGLRLSENLDMRKTYNVRIEYYNDVTTEGSTLIKFYIDGVLQETLINSYVVNTAKIGGEIINESKSPAGFTFATEDHDVLCVSFGIPSTGRDAHFYLDNSYMATEYLTDEGGKPVSSIGNGKYMGQSSVIDFENGSGGDRFYAGGTKLSAADMDAFVNTFGTANAGNEKIYYTYRTDESGNTYYEYNASNGARQTRIEADKTIGDTYVLATDFKWNGSVGFSEKSSPIPWFLRFGFRSVDATTGGDDTMLYIQGFSQAQMADGTCTTGDYYFTDGTYNTEEYSDALYLCYGSGGLFKDTDYYDTNNEVDDDSASKYLFAVLEKDVWYNLRIEYSPTSIVVNSETQHTIKGDLRVYVNGSCVLDTTVSYKKNIANITNESFGHAFIQGRGATLVDDYGYCLDNVYCTALSKSNDTTSTDDINGAAYDNSNTYDYDALEAAMTGLSFSGVDKLNSAEKDALKQDWARVVAEGDNKVLEIGSHSSELIVDWMTAKTTGEAYVFNTDLKLLGTTMIASTKASDPWLFKLAFADNKAYNNEYTKDGEPWVTRDDYMFALMGYANGFDNVDLYVHFGASKEYVGTVVAGEWYDLQIEYTPVSTAEGSYSGNVMISLDGEVLYNDVYDLHPNFSNTTFRNVYLEVRADADDFIARLDNTYATAVSSSAGGGINAADAIKFDGENEYTFGNIEGNSSAIVDDDGNNVLSIVKQAASDMNNGATATFYHAPLTTGATSYVYELDIKLLSEGLSMPESYDGTWTTKLAIRNKRNVELDQLVFTPVKNESGAVTSFAISVDTNTEVLGYISADSWHNIRIVFTPTSQTEMTKTVIVDGENEFTGVQNSVEGTKATADKSTFGYAQIQLRGWANYAAVLVDNVYTGTLGELLSTTPDVNDFEAAEPVLPDTFGNAVTSVKAEDTNKYYNISKSVANGKTGEYKDFFTPTSADAFVPIATGAIYVFEAKMRINDLVSAVYTVDENGYYTVSQAGSNWWLNMGFTDCVAQDLYNESKSSNQDNNTVGYNIGGVTKSTVSTSAEATADIYDANDATFFGKKYTDIKGEWVTVRMELRVVDVVGANASVTLYNYINGECVSETSNTTKLQVINGIDGVRIKTKSVGTGAKPSVLDYDIDDVTMYSYYTERTPDGELVFDFEGESEKGFFATNSSTGTTNTSTHVTVKTEGDNSYINTSATRPESGTPNPSGMSFLVFNDVDNVLGEAKVGSVYSVSFRMRVNELINDKKTDTTKGSTWAFYAGLLSSDTGAYLDDNACAFNNFTVEQSTTADYTYGLYGFTTGEWVTVRLEYAVTAISADTSITLTFTTYVNDEIYYRTNGAPQVSASDTNKYVALDDITGFAFKINGVNVNTSSGKLYSYDIDFDDIKISAYNVEK